MIRFVLILMPLALLAADGKQADPKAAPAAPATSAVPAGAAKIGPQAWRYTDKDGQTWIYRKTPFGITRAKEGEQASSAGAPHTDAIPAGAAEVAPGMWRYTGKDGKTWVYRRTPFGVFRVEEVQQKSPAQAPPLKATDLGDSVRFEQKTPFGSHVWTKSKRELTAEERAALESGNPAGAAPAKTAEK